MVQLDEQEELALKGFLETLEEQCFDPKPKVDQERLSRGPEGQIIVPVILQGSSPSLSLALLMGQKADQIYKQTACRFVVAQSLENDAHMRKYVWVDNAWKSIM